MARLINYIKYIKFSIIYSVITGLFATCTLMVESVRAQNLPIFIMIILAQNTRYLDG